MTTDRKFYERKMAILPGPTYSSFPNISLFQSYHQGLNFLMSKASGMRFAVINRIGKKYHFSYICCGRGYCLWANI